jgi:hypothetical protein
VVYCHLHRVWSLRRTGGATLIAAALATAEPLQPATGNLFYLGTRPPRLPRRPWTDKEKDPKDLPGHVSRRAVYSVGIGGKATRAWACLASIIGRPRLFSCERIVP